MEKSIKISSYMTYCSVQNTDTDADSNNSSVIRLSIKQAIGVLGF